MSGAAFFVDLPNFYSRLLKSGIESPRFLKNYFLEWLDFDLLARSLTNSCTGIWVFYSGERLGPSGERIEGKYLQDYVRRINALVGVTARDVNIRGEQREPVIYKCEKCGNEGIAESISEKGIDASLIVHLFDTMDSWDTAFLLSGDADFVPAVASLRRRGKIVIGVGFSDASSALVRECYDYEDIDEIFLEQDIFVYSLFRKEGVVQKWLTDNVKCDSTLGLPTEVDLRIRWGLAGHWMGVLRPSEPHSYYVRLDLGSVIDLTSRQETIIELQKKFPSQVTIEKNGDKVNGYIFTKITPLGLEGIRRRVPSLISSIQGLEFEEMSEQRTIGKVTYQLDQQTGEYKLATSKIK